MCASGDIWKKFMINRLDSTVGTMRGGELRITSYTSGTGRIDGFRYDNGMNQEPFSGTCTPPPGKLTFEIVINQTSYHFDGGTIEHPLEPGLFLVSGIYFDSSVRLKRERSAESDLPLQDEGAANDEQSAKTAAPFAIDPGEYGTWGGSQGGN
jgi:hypothetical protein